MPNAGIDQAVIVGGLNPVENKVFSVPTHSAADEKEIIAVGAARADTDGTLGGDKIKEAPSAGDDGDHDKNDDDEDGRSSDEVIIITGADAARHLLPMRDDFDTALTFRSLLLASGLSCFQAVMSQIYTVGGERMPLVTCLSLIGADLYTLSSNRRQLPFRALSSSSSPTSSARVGPPSSPAETSLRPGGGQRVARATVPSGYPPSTSSTPGHGH